MHIQFDITHPAHSWLFYNAYQELKQNHITTVTSREKDITNYLVEALGFEYKPVKALFKESLMMESMARELFFLAHVMGKKIDVFTAAHGVWAAHAAFILRKKCVLWVDTEFASFANKITLPFATVILTPSCYWHDIPKQVKYYGYHELAYLHPNRFTPDKTILDKYCLKQPFSIVRFVGWKASHDVKEKGFTLENKINVVHHLQKYGEVIISSEGELPDELITLQSKIDPVDMHHVLAHAQFLVGESATMASEASVLGVPSVFVATTGRGYTDEQESRYGLTKTFIDRDQPRVFKYIDRILSDTETPEIWRTKQARLLDEKIDVTDYMINLYQETDCTFEGIADFSQKYHIKHGIEQKIMQNTLT